MTNSKQLKKLTHFRKKIDQFDQDIVRLLNQRAQLVDQIWKWKKKEKLPLIDQKRESLILQKIQDRARPPLKPKSLRAIYQVLLHELHPARKGKQK